MIFKILKKSEFGKKGAVIDSTNSEFTEEALNQAVADGVLAESVETGEEGDEITFQVRVPGGKIKERVFSAEKHGDDFKELADEFHKTNEAHIVSRK